MEINNLDSQTFKQINQLFETERYITVGQNDDILVNAQLWTAALHYSRIREKHYFEADGRQVPGAHSEYGDPLMDTILQMLQRPMEMLTGMELHPTYSFYRIYREGQELKKHTDRPSCEVSATIMLGAHYTDKPVGWQWPIYVGKGKKITQDQGDMLIYRGCEVPHWRKPLDAGPGSYHSQLFIHYVDAAGPNAHFALDQRADFGIRKNVQKTRSVGVWV